jgi:hypothetical protein
VPAAVVRDGQPVAVVAQGAQPGAAAQQDEVPAAVVRDGQPVAVVAQGAQPAAAAQQNEVPAVVVRDGQLEVVVQGAQPGAAALQDEVLAVVVRDGQMPVVAPGRVARRPEVVGQQYAVLAEELLLVCRAALRPPDLMKAQRVGLAALSAIVRVVMMVGRVAPETA